MAVNLVFIPWFILYSKFVSANHGSYKVIEKPSYIAGENGNRL